MQLDDQVCCIFNKVLCFGIYTDLFMSPLSSYGLMHREGLVGEPGPYRGILRILAWGNYFGSAIDPRCIRIQPPQPRGAPQGTSIHSLCQVNILPHEQFWSSFPYSPLAYSHTLQAESSPITSYCRYSIVWLCE